MNGYLAHTVRYGLGRQLIVGFIDDILEVIFVYPNPQYSNHLAKHTLTRSRHPKISLIHRNLTLQYIWKHFFSNLHGTNSESRRVESPIRAKLEYE